MRDPQRPGKSLEWGCVVDYHHACQYLSQLAQASFGPGREAYAWAAKMRRTLKGQRGGVLRIALSSVWSEARDAMFESLTDALPQLPGNSMIQWSNTACKP